MTPASATSVSPETRTSPYRLTFPRVLRSEWIKLSTLRSTWWSIGIVALLTIGIALLVALAVDGPGFAGIQAVILPVQFTMLLAGILGVLAVTGEYSTGMIRSTLTADPSRGSVLAAKAVVVARLMFAASLVIFVGAALAITPILEPRGNGIAWGAADESFLPLLAAAFSMAIFALLGAAWGFLLRSGAGAIAASVGLLFVLPIVVSIFPAFDPTAWQWLTDLSAYLPSAASQSLILPLADNALSATVSLVTLCGWAVAGMLAAWAVLRMRDA